MPLPVARSWNIVATVAIFLTIFNLHSNVLSPSGIIIHPLSIYTTSHNNHHGICLVCNPSISSDFIGLTSIPLRSWVLEGGETAMLIPEGTLTFQNAVLGNIVKDKKGRTTIQLHYASTSGKHSFTLEHLRTPQMPWDALGHPGHQSTQGILYFSQG